MHGAAYIFHPGGGIVDGDAVGNDQRVHYFSYEREDAISKLKSRWDEHLHFGDIPDEHCINDAVTSDDTDVLCASTFDVPYRHEAGAEPESMTLVAMPCTTHVEPIGVKSWLMDSGTPLDLVSKADVKQYREFITKGPPVILDTANGEVKVRRRIELYNGVLDETIAPLVLGSTPSVLSIGRRVVQQGYDWHWKGFTTTPWMVHPVTGANIPLRGRLLSLPRRCRDDDPCGDVASRGCSVIGG